MEGKKADVRGLRLLLLCAGVSALLLVPAERASAGNISVTLAGAGAGSVVSEPAAIACSNNASPGGPGTGECSKSFGLVATDLTLTATPSPSYVFAGWGGTGAGACNSGLAPRCKFSLGIAGSASVSATFIPTPPLPIADTVGSGPGEAAHLTELEGTVNPNGSGLLGCRFEYGLTAAYGASVPCSPGAGELGAGSTPVVVSAETEPLEPNQTYHFRLVASNLGGSAAGDDLTFATGAPVADGCPNGPRRAEQGIAALLLPACMALEMVSPAPKNGQPARFPVVAADGDRVLFFSTAALGDTSGVLSATGDPYVASRAGSGWETAPTVPPAEFPRGWGIFPRAQSFSPDLSRWFHVASTFPQFEAGIGQVFQGSLGRSFVPISPLLIPAGGLGSKSLIGDTRFEAVSADHSHFYLTPGTATATYLPGDPAPAGPAADRNVYVAALGSTGEPSLQLLARDSSGKVWGGRCGVRMGGNRQANGLVSFNQGVVSADGRRAYFSTRIGQPQTGFCTAASRLRILERTETPAGPEIKSAFGSECARVAPPCSTADGDDRFQGASVDGTRLYFTSVRQLADSDVDATADLYLYDADADLLGPGLTQVSAGEAGDATPGSGAEVLGNVTAISGDGSHAYFVAKDVLTTDPNPAGATAVAGQPNLYLYRRNASNPGGDTVFVGTLAAGDSAGLWGDRGGLQNQAYPVPVVGRNGDGDEVGGDGHLLLLLSKAPLAPADIDGGRLDAFRYDSVGGTLVCISCKAGPPDGAPFDVASRGNAGAAGTDIAEQGRWASEDGQTVVFTSAQPLLAGDGNGLADFFLWREGQLYRLPGRAFAQNPAAINVPVLSHDGDEVAFQTGTPLLPQDGDDAPDIYLARVGGGFENPPPVPVCTFETCQEPFVPQSPSPAAPSEVPRSGNPKYPPRCKKGFVRRGGKCVKKPRGQKRSQRQHRNQTDRDRRAAR